MNDYKPLGPWITTDQAAEYLQLAPPTVRKLIRRRELRAVRIGKTYRTTKQWCDEYMTGKTE